MKASKRLVVIDTVTQGVLIWIVALGFLPALVLDFDEGVFFSLLALPVLGAWQVMSNIFWMLWGQGPSRAWYLAGVLVFFTSASLLSRFFPFFQFSHIAGMTLWFGIPIGFAIWSFWLTANQLAAAKRTPASFWDI